MGVMRATTPAEHWQRRLRDAGDTWVQRGRQNQCNDSNDGDNTSKMMA
jgi:hypothetical protein